MNEKWLAGISALFALIILFITTESLLYPKSERNWKTLKLLKPKGIIVGILGIAIIWINVCQVTKSLKVPPILTVTNNGIKHKMIGSTYDFDIYFIAAEAPITIKYIDYFVEIRYVDGSIDTLEKKRLLTGDQKVPKDKQIFPGFQILDAIKIDSVFIALNGIYTPTEEYCPIYFKEVYCYSLQTGENKRLQNNFRDAFFTKYKLEK